MKTQVVEEKNNEDTREEVLPKRKRGNNEGKK
jgi:hypothetical protein